MSQEHDLKVDNAIDASSHNILVVGSSNTDMVVQSDHLPRPGETVLGGTFFMNPGGKGANQAVAAARLGGDVTFVCKVGNDIFGQQASRLFEDEGIDTSFVFTDPVNPSGVALISVDSNAENCISVASGANANLLPSDLKQLDKAMDKADLVLMQLEIPLVTVEHVADVASRKGKRVILNPAPACKLTDELLGKLFLITPNETEAEMISGIKVTDELSAKEAARVIKAKGVENVIVTLGSKGALLYTGSIVEIIPAERVEAIDTTAAGDVFNGALVVALSEGYSLRDASRFASKASAISVTRAGAQSSAPYRYEINQ